MKNVLITGLQILIIWGLTGCPHAIIAAPTGKDYLKVDHKNSLSLWEVITNKRKKIDKDGYLSASVIPQLVISSFRTRHSGGHIEEDSRLTEFVEGDKPTLKSFLNYLETEKDLKDSQESSHSENTSGTPAPADDTQSADGNSTTAGLSVEEEAATVEQPSGEELPGEGPSTVQTSNFPIFPRPFARTMVEENLFIYFPVEGMGVLGQPLYIDSHEAIFLPPEGEKMQSTVTMNVEP